MGSRYIYLQSEYYEWYSKVWANLCEMLEDKPDYKIPVHSSLNITMEEIETDYEAWKKDRTRKP